MLCEILGQAGSPARKVEQSLHAAKMTMTWRVFNARGTPRNEHIALGGGE
jgi:alkylated DNA nucleotide flippase Atl1